MICKFCGKEIPDDSTFCTECGTPVKDTGANSYEYSQNKSFSTDGTEELVVVDPQRDKTMAIVAYFTWIGFIIAMVSDSKNSTLTKFHLNQSLVLHIATILAGLVPRVGALLGVVCFVFWIMGLVSAAQGEMKELPVISEIKLIK